MISKNSGLKNVFTLQDTMRSSRSLPFSMRLNSFSKYHEKWFVCIVHIPLRLSENWLYLPLLYVWYSELLGWSALAPDLLCNFSTSLHKIELMISAENRHTKYLHSQWNFYELSIFFYRFNADVFFIIRSNVMLTKGFVY